MGTPFVMVYRVSPLTYALGRPRVKVSHFAMVNLIAGEEVVTELVQDRFTAENVVSELQKIVPEGPDRRTMIEKLAEVKIRLRGEQQDHLHPADRTAEAVLELVRGAHPGGARPSLSGLYAGLS